MSVYGNYRLRFEVVSEERASRNGIPVSLLSKGGSGEVWVSWSWVYTINKLLYFICILELFQESNAAECYAIQLDVAKTPSPMYIFLLIS